jgi:hypothetical protein
MILLSQVLQGSNGGIVIGVDTPIARAILRWSGGFLKALPPTKSFIESPNGEKGCQTTKKRGESFQRYKKKKRKTLR